MAVMLYILIRREVSLQKFLYNKLEESQKKLIEQNKKLKEYAFVTSHHLRKPLANILALVQLFNEHDLSDPNNRVAIENIKLSSEDLDIVIRETNEIIDGNSEVID
jgi:light-regulated signal transduction histidine kinase (bacteriophytochrome)